MQSLGTMKDVGFASQHVWSAAKDLSMIGVPDPSWTSSSEAVANGSQSLWLLQSMNAELLNMAPHDSLNMTPAEDGLWYNLSKTMCLQALWTF
jgi:hypothetical protein